jgi:membrane protease YdiL (CAAX protease family)
MDVTENVVESAPPVAARPKSRFQRVLQFPLVALALAFLLVVFAQVLGAGVSYLAGNRPGGVLATPADVVFALASTILVVLAYKLIVVRMGEQPRDDLPFDSRARDVASGFAQGALVFSAIVGVAALIGTYQVLGLSAAQDWLPLLVGTGLMAGVTEEIMLRGIVFRWLEEFGGSWVALALSALIFGFLHAGNPNATLISSLSIALAAGVLLGGAYMLTRNLWLAIGMHAGWNVTQGLVWDVPVSGFALDGWVESRLVGDPILSGGSFGLEASVITMVVATAYGGWLVYRSARRGNLVRNWWARRELASNEAVGVDVDADAHSLGEA